MNLLNRLNRLSLKAVVSLQCFKKDLIDGFNNDERGVSPIVATVLTILITILLAAIFWDYLQSWFEGLWKSITDKSNTIK